MEITVYHIKQLNAFRNLTITKLLISYKYDYKNCCIRYKTAEFWQKCTNMSNMCFATKCKGSLKNPFGARTPWSTTPIFELDLVFCILNQILWSRS